MRIRDCIVFFQCTNGFVVGQILKIVSFSKYIQLVFATTVLLLCMIVWNQAFQISFCIYNQLIYCCLFATPPDTGVGDVGERMDEWMYKYVCDEVGLWDDLNNSKHT